MNATKRGLLLLNLGTPDAPEPQAVGRYLSQFLMDKWVIGAPFLIRWFLVKVLIVPKRKIASAHAYQTVWTEKGSPLLIHLKDLHEQVKPLVPEMETAIGMRYGNPSIESALRELEGKGVDEILVFPLYPQYAESTTRSSREECERVAKAIGLKAKLTFVKDYFDHPAFIDSFLAKIRPVWEAEKPDHLLMTFHGLPETHVKKTDPTGGNFCLQEDDCCAQMTAVNRDCYRAQCYATARTIANRMRLRKDQYTVSFQSRLGPTKWIRPYTDQVLAELGRKGIKKLAVACPSFAADCLETIEEIGERGKETFLQAGGQSFSTIACPNADPRWARGVVEIANEAFIRSAKD